MSRVVVLGSANIDLVVRVPRHPAPGETVTGTALTTVPGGKGANQAIAAARAGADVALLAAVGDDPEGARLRETLAASGVDVSGVRIVDEPTGTAHVVVDDAGENAITVVPGANGTWEALDDETARAVAEADHLLLQLELPLPVVRAALAHARLHGTTTVLTPAPADDLATGLDDDLLADVDLLVPNRHEAARLSGRNAPDEAAEVLLERGVGAVVVTLGADGCLHADGSFRTRHPAPVVDAVDTTAAGDAFVGAMVAELAAGREMDDAIAVATTAAALSVQRPGASSSLPTRAEIDQARATR